MMQQQKKDVHMDVNSYKGLAHGILLQALKDISKGVDVDGVAYFAGSEWCSKLCDYGNINNQAYREKVAEKIERYYNNLKVPRVKSYMIQRFLHETAGKGKSKKFAKR